MKAGGRTVVLRGSGAISGLGVGGITNGEVEVVEDEGSIEGGGEFTASTVFPSSGTVVRWFTSTPQAVR